MIGYVVVLTMVVVACVAVLVYLFQPHDSMQQPTPEEGKLDE